MIKFLTLSIFLVGFLWSRDIPLDIGDRAPDFSLPDENGQMHTLSQYTGQRIVLYFYPKDGTPGCTKEACGIRDSYSEFEKDNIVVFGISYDDDASHRQFKNKHDIPFHLLTDEDKSVSKLYGAEGMFFPSRKTYLIGDDGTLLNIYEKVNVLNHAEDILRYFSESN